MTNRNFSTILRRAAVAIANRAGLLAVCLFLLLFSIHASPKSPGPQKGSQGKPGIAVAHVVVNFRELARQQASAPPRQRKLRVMPEEEAEEMEDLIPDLSAMREPPSLRVPRIPPPPLQVASPATSTNFLAGDDNGFDIPPDTHGAVGPNHLVVALNSDIKIQDRLGNQLSSVTIDTFWTPAGANGTFDPRVLYDPFADRWIMTATSDARLATSSVLIGTSQTNDPTGNWDLHKIDGDAANLAWVDYPTVGFNKDWIVVCANMFTITNDTFSNENIWVFTKSTLYSGTATFRKFTDTISSGTPAVTLDNNLGTLFFVKSFNGNFNGQGFLSLGTLTGTVGAEIYTSAQPGIQIGVPNPWTSFQPGGDFAPQMGIAVNINAGDARILNVVVRNNSIWAAHTVFLPAGAPTHTAAQWWQISLGGTVQQFGRVEDPTGNIFYAYPTIAVNSQNDVLLGYSSFSATQFASANYSFRAGSDPANTMQQDASLKAGVALYNKTLGGSSNRWGDYSATLVDPMNDRDLWTIQEFASAPPLFGQGRWATWWGKITVSPSKKRRGQTISQ
ncbi:MAG: hypothetical protein HY046_13225 [Acidobacteria bacterium]|nr:hypothetical protein [Acidobacteriota bacterium]